MTLHTHYCSYAFREYNSVAMRKLWNRPDYPVWSLVTLGPDSLFNMNICTYVTVFAMEPKSILVAVYTGTKSHRNITAGKKVRLQLLTERQAFLVRLLGRKSGNMINKITHLEKSALLSYTGTWPYLTHIAGYVDLQITKIITTGQDHDLVLGSIIAHKNLSEEPILTTTYLKDKHFTR